MPVSCFRDVGFGAPLMKTVWLTFSPIPATVLPSVSPIMLFKIAGILIENSIMGQTLGSSVAGIGLNVNQTGFRSGAPNPVSLKQVTGKAHDLKDITGELISLLDRRYGMVVRGEGALLESEYHAALYRAGEWQRYSDSSGGFEGMIERVMHDGMLLVRRRDGSSREYAFREIDYIL